MTGFAGDRVLKAKTPRWCLNLTLILGRGPEWLALELVTCIPTGLFASLSRCQESREGGPSPVQPTLAAFTKGLCCPASERKRLTFFCWHQLFQWLSRC